ncbi:universal stress protein [Paraburkholderia sp. J12]|uniref:universal stress protein n=1 Tax=Paraburkholderia sp. J12 TaxID=2805432 RepID=UPI002ABD6858|nr:universal stress protein [Paraburkholderia sp. J12]
MYTKILVAVGASQDNAVLASAIETARKYDAQLYALHVVDPTPCFLGPADSDYGLIVEAMEAHGREIAARVSRKLDEEALGGETHLVTMPLTGSMIGREIAAFAAEKSVDLIVLGKRRPGWWRWLDEDVAAAVRRHTEAPVQIASGQRELASAHRAGTGWSTVPSVRAR